MVVAGKSEWWRKRNIREIGIEENTKNFHRRVSLECVQNCLAGSIFIIFHGKGGEPGKFDHNQLQGFLM